LVLWFREMSSPIAFVVPAHHSLPSAVGAYV
jgi:hypothetical protein